MLPDVLEIVINNFHTKVAKGDRKQHDHFNIVACFKPLYNHFHLPSISLSERLVLYYRQEEYTTVYMLNEIVFVLII